MQTKIRVIKDFGQRREKAITKAQKRIDSKKDEIIAETKKEYPLSMNLICKKYGASYPTLIKSMDRWGLDSKALAKEMNKRRVNECSASAGKDAEKIISNTDSIIERLSKNYPDRFIDICTELGSQPTTVKKVLLENGADIIDLVKEGRKKRMAHFHNKNINIESIIDRLKADLPDTFVSICKELCVDTRTIKSMAVEKGYDIELILKQARARRLGVKAGKSFEVEKTLLNMAWV
jgi:hypothetical protein